ncbi:hypothetical protein Roomu2_00045 [Pseudomonas phage vB_PpuM-Roomu-2]|uniref:KOW domain-containing protein n=2 Tax=Tartuvirus TaxID=3424912 RepID=A0AAX4MZS7_9CAUD
MKIGDKVRIIKGPYKSDNITPGNTGVVVSISSDIDGVTLYDVLPDIEPDTDWPFYGYELEVVE